jgi:predicted PurR-regulated permease PerM/methylmalonyl-CoA mutase cobalamin-binding subunit
MATQAERAPRSGATPLFALVVATAVLYLAREVLIPLALAVLLAFMLAPLVRRFESWKLGRVPSVLLAVLVGITIIAGLGATAGYQAVGLTAKLPEYRKNISQKLKDLRSPPRDGNLGKAAKAIKELESEAAGKEKGAPKPAAEPPAVKVPTTPLEVISRVGAPIGLLLAVFAAIVVVSTLILLNRHDLRDRIVRLVGEGWIHVTTQAMEDAAGRVSRYLLTLLVVNVTYGALLAVAFWAIGLPNALLWGLIATILRFVPYIGAPAAAVLPVALAFAISDGWSLVAWTVGAIVVIDALIAYVVEPMLYGARTGLTPIAVVLAALFWTWLWGPAGLLLATPITVCIAVVARYIPDFSFLAVILSDEPVLTPPVRFYQRLVAMEYEEAYELAEQLSREQGLAALFDAMLLPALVLAKRDRHRYSLEPERERFVLESMLRIAEELADDARGREETEGERKEPPVPVAAPHVCIVPAHDEHDHVAAVMLARLLAPEHFEAILLPRDMLAAELVEKVGESGAKVVCISSVPPQAATNASYLAKRLRARFPKLRIVVALWLAQGGLDAIRRRLDSSGGDEVATRLPEALDKLRLVTPPRAG